MATTSTTDPHPQSAAASTALRVSGLVSRYGSFEAVRGIDLDVRTGEVFALLGTNGAGKTTTLETIEGHRRPSEGTVEVLGRDPHRDRRLLAPRLGTMFQEPSTPDELTPAETLATWLALTGCDGDVDVHLRRVDLAHRRDVVVTGLSGGERRRLDLAIALATDPELLLLDEPTTGLDPESRTRTWQTIRDVAAGGSTVVLTTHYLEEAEALADRVAILHEGRVAIEGTLEEVRSQQPARITCLVPGDAPALPRLGGAVEETVDHQGARVTIRTRTLQPDLTVLLTWAAGAGVQLRDLQAAEPSLAEIFSAISTPTIEGADR